MMALLFGSILWQIGQKRSTLQDLYNILGDRPAPELKCITSVDSIVSNHSVPWEPTTVE